LKSPITTSAAVDAGTGAGFDDIEAARSALNKAQEKTRRGETIGPAGVNTAEVAERHLVSRASPGSASGRSAATGLARERDLA